MPFSLGVRRISQLVIDGDKDFSGRAILNARLSSPVLSGTVSGTPTWASAQVFPSPLTGGNLVLHDTGLTLPRTFTFPDLADTVVTLAAAQTLSNKTLSAPVFSGTITGTYTLGGSPTLASDLALSGARTIGGALTVDPVNRRVGIGTTAPEGPLHVRLGIDNFVGPVRLPSTNPTAFAMWWRFEGWEPDVIFGIGVHAPTASLGFWRESLTGDVSLSTLTPGAPRMVISSVGNIGIGTTVPVQRLHVEGNTYISGNVGIGTTAPETKLNVQGGTLRIGTSAGNYQELTGGDEGLRHRWTNDPGGNYRFWLAANAGNVFGLTGNDGGALRLADSAANHVMFYIRQGGGGTLRAATTDVLTFTNVGNVGIGTTAPEFRLDVVGSAVIRGDIVPRADNEGNIGLDDRRWARIRSVLVVAGDYVFENGWRLTERGEGIALLRPDGSVAAVWN